ncbi:MAG TPA: zf-HC2 domain-containing protein [Terracidiphilus sp.]
MKHSDAIQQMATERYLLNELTPEEREAFEEHVFDCPECALDLRAGSVFITEAKAQLPELLPQSSVPVAQPARPAGKKRGWSFWIQPAFAIPAFAVLLGVVAYQNISVIPGLKEDAVAPRILHSTAIHIGTRGSARTPITADRTEGLALSFELPQTSTYSSFVFELHDPTGQQVWTHTVSGSTPDAGDDGIVSLVIPGAGLREGSYILVISGVGQQGTHAEIDRRNLDIQFSH